jgi:subtilase family serine protease
LAAPSETISIGPGGKIITPASSQPIAGKFAHTNIHLLVPPGKESAAASVPSGKYENPPSLACLYKLVKVTKGCNPETLTAVAQGGSKVVVIVDAYDYPTAQNDLSVFAKQYGLPAITGNNFQVVYATGTKPSQDSTGGWELEEALDIEMAHALAPKAKVVLVEAASNSFDDLFTAESVAAGIAVKAGGGEVSNSWGGSEFSGEEDNESTFTGANVVFFASSGDSPGVEVPSAFSNVVGVGGTSVNRDGNGNFISQTVWSSTGGGISQYVPIPSYQSAIANIVGSSRGIPDVSLVANPNTGVWMYDTTPYNGHTEDWLVIGGTSVASPATAAIVNNVKSFAANSPAELTTIYANLGNKKDFTDVTAGTCNNGAKTLIGWDDCTGVGTPYGKKGK